MKTATRKIISLVLAVVMVFGLLCSGGLLPRASADACGYSPEMSASELLASGEAAQSSRSYNISSSSDLMAFASYVNSGLLTEGVTFYLTTDVDLTQQLSAADWVPIGSSAQNAFKGVFDGCGFAVVNLNIQTDQRGAALFGNVIGAEAAVLNLGVGGSISAASDAAGIAVNLEGARIANCWNAANVSGSSADGYVAGIAANVIGGRIENCCNYGYITGSAPGGAIAGHLSDSSSVTYSYYVYYSADRAFGLADSSSSTSIYRFASSSTEVLTEKALPVYEGSSRETDDLITLLNEWISNQSDKNLFRDWLYDTSDSAVARTAGRYPTIEYPGYILPTDSIYTATASMTALYESGRDATSGAFYSISSAQEMYYLAEYVNTLGLNTAGATFFLTQDILLAAAASSTAAINWTPIGSDSSKPFRGVFDAQGYIIAGLYLDGGNNLG
ncbi:MAG: hypothetical protein Q4B42_05405, partial [Oscillospiraceae bacterium]|nr:hypothetical protein [Oscillospiraceae bacterium]